MKSYTCTSGVHSPNENIVFAEWLNGFDWRFYCTLTTRYSLSMRAARRAAERLYGYLQKKFGEVELYWVAEPFDATNGYHIHALLNLGNTLLKNAEELIKKAWQVVTKGKGGKEYNNTVIKPYDKALGGHFYVSKYMMRFDSDYDFFPKQYKHV